MTNPIPERFRRPLLIVGFVLAVIVLFALIYTVFLTGGTTNENANGNGNTNAGQAGNLNIAGNRNVSTNAATNTSGELPIARVANGGETLVSPITKAGVQFVATDANSRDLLYYDSATGQFFRTTGDGRTTTLLTDDAFPQVSNVTWTPQRDKAILEFPDQSKVLYDFASKQQSTLPREVSSFSFSPSGEKVAWKFTGTDANDNWLQVADPNGANAQSIEPLGANADRVQVSWSPNNQVIAFYRSSAGLDTEEVLPLGANDENYPTMLVNGRGFTGQWAPGGTRLIYSVYSADTNYNPELWVTTASGGTLGQERVSLGVNTWADKCAFSTNSSTVYCAVPQYLDAGSGIYPDLARSVPDLLYRIDLATGTKDRVAIPVGSGGERTFSARNLNLKPGDSAITFTDQLTNQVYSLLLK